MPHFRQVAAVVLTLRRDGVTSRRDNALRTETDFEIDPILLEDGDTMLAESGNYMQME